ncbi:MAG: hypothetical protein AMXMBFR8_26950 [Nevskiales bacterium]
MKPPTGWEGDLPVLIAHWKGELATQREVLEIEELAQVVYPEVLAMQRTCVAALAECVAALERRAAGQPPKVESS